MLHYAMLQVITVTSEGNEVMLERGTVGEVRTYL